MQLSHDYYCIEPIEKSSLFMPARFFGHATQQPNHPLRWRSMLIVSIIIAASMFVKVAWDILLPDNGIWYKIGYWGSFLSFTALTLWHVASRQNTKQPITESLMLFTGLVCFLYFYFVDLTTATNGYLIRQSTILGTLMWMNILYVAAFIVWPLGRALLFSIIVHSGLVIIWVYFALQYDTFQDITLRQGDFSNIVITGIIMMVFNAILKQMTTVSTQERTMAELAIKDTLTNLPNRLYIDKYLQEHVDNASSRPQVALAICDIDHFKKVNDQFGHAVGDKALQEFAKVVQKNIRSSDLFGRYGGEEFVLAFFDTDEQEAARLCDNLRQRIREHHWHTIHHDLSLSASFGVSDGSSLDQQHDYSFEKILHQADIKLYEAKHSGRNRVCY